MLQISDSFEIFTCAIENNRVRHVHDIVIVKFTISCDTVQTKRQKMCLPLNKTKNCSTNMSEDDVRNLLQTHSNTYTSAYIIYCVVINNERRHHQILLWT